MHVYISEFVSPSFVELRCHKKCELLAVFTKPKAHTLGLKINHKNNL